MNQPVNTEDELETLFDTISDARQAELRTEGTALAKQQDQERSEMVPHAKTVRVQLAQMDQTDLYSRIGALTRQLHEALREVGGDQALTRAVREVPDARSRLSYVARMTEQAADRVLAAVEIAQSGNRTVRDSVAANAAKWEQFFEQKLDVAGFSELVKSTRVVLAEVEGKSQAIDSQLHEIMMAQDFQDLTGQVIQKLIGLVNDLESKLLRFLIEALPPERQAEFDGELSGPVVRTDVEDVVTDQAQVDDLLDSLGF